MHLPASGVVIPGSPRDACSDVAETLMGGRLAIKVTYERGGRSLGTIVAPSGESRAASALRILKEVAVSVIPIWPAWA